MNSCGPQFGPRPGGVAHLRFDRSRGLLVHGHREAGAAGVKRGRPDAVVERQADDVDRLHSALGEHPLEVGVLEPRVPLVVAVAALVENQVDATGVEIGMQLRPRGVTDAMHWPRAALVRERAVIRWMPVPCGDHERRGGDQPVDRLDHRVTIDDGERAARAEVVLHVDDDQGVHRTSIYFGGVSGAMRSIYDELASVLLTPEQAIALEVSGRTNAAVLVPLYLENDQLHAVFTRRRDDLRRHAGEISFPGGRHDDTDHDLVATALREAEEEIGLPVDAVEIVGALQPTPTIATDYAVYPFVGLIAPGLSWTMSAREVAEVIELSLDELLAGYGRRRLVRRGLPIRTDTYIAGDHLIWGATARILADLFDRIGPMLAAA
jgi:8-oxo-dGTP pyrophosphatase MutT (NUDIX family)